MNVVITGAGGFLGSHLAVRLKLHGHHVTGIDLKDPEFSPRACDVFRHADLRERIDPRWLDGAERVYALAADMGGMGYIHANGGRILHDNLLIDVNTLEAASEARVGRLLYASSACVYNEDQQATDGARPLREADAYPAKPDTDYGWEKLTAERLCAAYRRERGLLTTSVRFHNVYGPCGTWRGGREKVPAALCRKVAVAKLLGRGHVEVWGDGQQRRSFLFIGDFLDGVERLMESGHPGPVNLGTDRSVSVDELLGIVLAAARFECEVRHVEGPVGVRGRNSDNALMTSVAGGWSPVTPLEDGIAATYAWVEQQVREAVDRGEDV